MSEERLSLEVPGGAVSGVLSTASGAAWLFVYAPGAASNVDDPFALHLAAALPSRRIDVLRFQFLYQERKKGGPDRAPVLEATWGGVLAHARALAATNGQRVAIGGRSMGGRMASHLAAAGDPVDALALFAYPLHPPGKPGQRRDEHLPQISVPTLFCSGTRDGFASPDELSEAAALVPSAHVHFLEGADHGFSIPKSSSGRTRADVWREAGEALLNFLEGL